MENKKRDYNFVKVGETISFKYSTEGLDYNLEPNRVYTLKLDSYTDQITLHTSIDLVLPEKVYTTKEHDKFIKKALNYYNKTTEGVTGIMLSGLKGSGKTVMMKQIAMKSNLPIIMLDKSFRSWAFKDLFKRLKNINCCFIFDEVDKLGDNYDSTHLLQVLDGAATSGKHMMIFTCNDSNKLDDCLIDRCSRIRYWKEFDELSEQMITIVLKENLKDPKKATETAAFIQKNFDVISFDNILSFVEEINTYPEDKLEDLFEDMNLSQK